MALPNEDQFSEEKFMVGDNSEKMYNPEPKLGEAFETMDPENYQVEDNRNERLAVKAVELAKENEQLKADNAKYKIDLKGKALPKIDEKPLVNIDTSSLSSFATSVGDSFMNLAEVVPNKIEEIASDPVKKKNFMRGLEIINASSGIKPIGQAKSPFGAVAEGLLKAEKGFIATDIAMEKAKKQEPRRYKSPGEELLVASMTDYRTRQQFKKDMDKSINDRFNIVRKVAIEGKELPTGILNATFRDLKGVLVELNLGEKYDALANKIASEDYIKKNGNRMAVDEQIIFNDLFQAATFEQVVQDVKKLYPVSNKDIDTLLKTKGDIGSRPEALRKLVAAQMATNDIAMASEEYAYKYFELGDQQFEKKSILMSEKMIADKLRKENKVTDTTLEKLFGTTKDITDAGYITASYYQQLLAQKDQGAGDPFTIFVTAKKKEEEEIEDIIKKNQTKD
jgi:hypothetical protein